MWLSNPNLGVFATLKEGCDPNKTDIVIPEHCIGLLIARNLVLILEDYLFVVSEVIKSHSSVLTLKPFPSGFAKEVLLFTIVRNVTRTFCDPAKLVNSILEYFRKAVFVEVFEGREIHYTIYFGVGRTSRLFVHLWSDGKSERGRKAFVG
jgi:hypothetical protein